MSMSSLLQDQIATRLQQSTLAPTLLRVVDDSEQHAGHDGYHATGSHFTIHIASPTFAGKSRVAIHRAIYAILADWIPTPIHALNLRIYEE